MATQAPPSGSRNFFTRRSLWCPFQIDFHAREHPLTSALAYSNPFTRRSLKSERRETLEVDILKRLNGVTAGYRKLGLPHRKDNKVTSTAF